MISAIQTYCDHVSREFDQIPEERKELLEKISAFIKNKQQKALPVNLIYICTHNSRRSHFGQIWAKVAGMYYGCKDVNTYSGGTEATAFHVNAIHALKTIGFIVKPIHVENNPVYHVTYDEKEAPILCFSKMYDDPRNPQKNFAAILTCSDAEENCPFIPGAELRVGTTYDDPKAFDGTPLQAEKYSERCKQIALETLYVFSKL